MKTNFGLSITNRKTVKGDKIFTIEVFSTTGEILGRAIVKAYTTQNRGGIFLKYIPAEDAKGSEPIGKIKILAHNQETVKDILNVLKKWLLLEGLKNAH